MEGIIIQDPSPYLWQEGIKPGFSYGVTDDFGYNIVKDPMHVHDPSSHSLLHQFGVDHEKMIYKTQIRRFRLTKMFQERSNTIFY